MPPSLVNIKPPRPYLSALSPLCIQQTALKDNQPLAVCFRLPGK